MRRALKSKIQKIAYVAMFAAAFSMAVPTPALAAIADATAPEAAQAVEVVDKQAALDAEGLLTPEELKAQSDRCTGIFFGSDTTTTGDTFIGRSEDLNGNNRKDFHYVPAATHDPEKDFYHDIDEHPDFKYPMPKKTVGYTAVHDTPDAWDISDDDIKAGAYYRAYAANGINDNGVAITATTTTYMNKAAEKVDPVTAGGLSEASLGDVILSQAESPRHACEVAGKIISEVGAGEGYQFYAGDTKGTWMFSTLSGHQWIAFRIPSNDVMVNPNIGGLQFKIDINNPEVCIHSKDMITLAEKNGFAKYYEDGTFDPFDTYGNYEGGTGNNGSVNSRLWLGYNYLTGSAEEADKLVKEHPLFFSPGRKFNTFDILRMLGYTGTGTKFDADQKIKGWTPAGKDHLVRAAYGTNDRGETVYPIGNMNQLQAHVFQVRNTDKLPGGLRIIEWMSMGPAAYGVFLPHYAGLLTETPEIYAPGSNDHAGQGADVDDPVANKSMYWVMTDYNKLVADLVNKGADMSSVKDYRDSMQKDLIRQQKEFEAAMLELDPSQWTAAANKITETLSNELYQRTLDLNTQLRAYRKAGDFSKPFVVQNTEPLSADKVLLENGMFKAGVLADVESRTLNYDYKTRVVDVLDGAGQTVVKGNAYSFRIDHKPAGLALVSIDDVAITDDMFTVSEGSTLIKFNADESKTLTPGEHVFKAVYADGSMATASFTVTEAKAETQAKGAAPKQTSMKKGTPQTGDSISVIAAISTALAGAGAIALGRRKDQ